MNVIKYPERKEWSSLVSRPVFDQAPLEKKIRKILGKVKKDGDKAVRKFTREFDGVKRKDLLVSADEINEAVQQIPETLRQAIRMAKNNIEKFHAAQLQSTTFIETMPGVRCWRNAVPIEKVGLYIPGGSAPLFSTVLMLGIPAKMAGCKEIVLCSPPGDNSRQTPHPAVLMAAAEIGITRIICAGGVQAIGAMAYGTETVPQVYKIFGPGNQYVNCAKQLLQADGIAIDMPAGPSEVCVLADDSADPRFIAADLLSQAEHGPDSQVILVTWSAALIKKVEAEIKQQVQALPRKKIALQALENSRIFLMNNVNDAVDLVNAYAAEHLIICCENDERIGGRIINAGSVFLGNYSPESAGDYASGTNHALPTNGYARSYSGVSLDSFVKKITYQKLTKEGLKNIGQTIIAMAEAESLQAHANAVSIRLDQLNKES